MVETGAIRKRVLGGEAFDVIMVPRDASDEFLKANRIAAGSQAPLIRVNFGLAVRADAPRPDTSTPDALRKTFLAAKRVLITDPATGGISGVHLMEVLNKLGIAEEMKDKLVPNRGSGHHAERVVKGEADLAVQAEHEIRCVPGAAFLDYPKELQRSIVFIGGVGAATTDAAAAKAYLTFVTGPRGRAGDQGEVPVAGVGNFRSPAKAQPVPGLQAEQAENALPYCLEHGADDRKHAKDQLPQEFQNLPETHGADFRDQRHQKRAGTDNDDGVRYRGTCIRLRWLAGAPEPGGRDRDKRQHSDNAGNMAAQSGFALPGLRLLIGLLGGLVLGTVLGHGAPHIGAALVAVTGRPVHRPSLPIE